MKKRLSHFLYTLLILATLSYSSHSTVLAQTTQNEVNQDLDTTDGNTDVSWPKGPNANTLTSSSAVLMDADTGLILYNKNMTDKHYPASITKIMTTLLAIENCSLDETVTFTADEVLNLESGASNINTQVGEKLTIEQCLYGIMLASANEVCNGVADHISGDIESFGKLMTSRAKELGCVNTNFTNPNGLHSDDHYTCAYDMALIGKEALKDSTFRKVANTAHTYLDKTNKSDARSLYNHHNMINAYTTSQFLYPDCIGGKTGYTSAAQSTLVTFAQRNDITLVCVVMEGTSSKTDINHNIYTDTQSLLNFGFDNYQMHNLSEATSDTTEEVASPFFTLYDSIMDTEHSPIQTSNSGKVLLPNGVNLNKATQEVSFFDAQDTTKEENEIGTVTYTYGNKTVGSTNIYFQPEISKNRLTNSSDIKYSSSTYVASKSKRTTNIFRQIFMIAGIVVVVVALGIYIYIFIQKRRQSKLRYRNGRRRS